MLTDDARVVDPGFCQLEVWSTRQPDQAEYWGLPACSSGEGREWALGANRARQGPSDSSIALIQYKRIARNLEPQSLGAAWTVGAQSSATGWRSYLNFPISWLSRDERSLLHLNVGLASPETSTRWGRPWGLAMEHRLSRPLWLIAERYSTDSERWQVQAGVRWWIMPERLQVDATWGRQKKSLDATAFASLGIRWVFPAP